MEAIKSILNKFGYKTIEEVPNDKYAEISIENHDDLIIEKISPNRISVSHTYLQNGDIMRDPEIVFKEIDDSWVAVMYQQDSTGTYKQDEQGLKSTTTFAHNTWNKNIEEQGYIEAAEQQEEIFT